MKITVSQYFGAKIGHPDATQATVSNAIELLDRVNALLEHAAAGRAYQGCIDPDTGTQISGSPGGKGDGGFRLSTATTGASNSKHKRGQAVDVYDPLGDLDFWLNDAILVSFELYREAPEKTSGWCHLQSVPPGSGKRTFYP